MATKKTKDRRKKLSAKKWAKEYKSGQGGFAYNIPEGVERFELKKAGVRRIIIVPYAAGKGNPYADEGELHWERTFFSHPRIGPNNESFLCMQGSFGKKCRVCEQRAELAQDPDTHKDTLDALKPKQRQLWNVFDLDAPEKGNQVWELAQFSFGKLLRERVENEDEDEDISSFADPEDGKVLKLTISEESYNGRPTYKVAAIDFKERKTPLPEEVLEAAVCLDELLIKPRYEDVCKIFDQSDDEDEEEEEAPKKKKRRSPVDEDEEEEEAPKKKKKRKVEAADDEDDDEPPKKKRKSRRSVDEDEDDEIPF